MRISQSYKEDPNTLPTHDDEIYTGAMGGCVSIVVLWGLTVGRYANVIGIHGSGGIRAISFRRLFANVPNNNGTLVFVIPGSSYTSSDQLALLSSRVDDKIRNKTRSDNMAVFLTPAVGAAWVNRNGQIRS